MLCDKCKKNIATYHSKTVINGVSTEEHLCSSCARKNGAKPFELISNDLFNSFSMLPFISDNQYDIEDLSDDIFDDGFLRIYDSQNNKDILSQAKNAINIGAQKIKSVEENSENKELNELQQKLKKAVEDENYEEASKLKKEIDKLKDNNSKNKED